MIRRVCRVVAMLGRGGNFLSRVVDIRRKRSVRAMKVERLVIQLMFLSWKEATMLRLLSQSRDSSESGMAFPKMLPHEKELFKSRSITTNLWKRLF